MENLETNDIFLLTGAGFTKNFGGFLATEMWSQIFNNNRVQSSQKLRELLQDNFDFESIYSKVIDSDNYSTEEKKSIQESIKNAYKELDDIVRSWNFNTDSPYPVNIYGLNKLFQRIWPGPYIKPSLIFTLNQDLFIERRWGHPSPGAPRFNQSFYLGHSHEINESDFVTLPNEDIENKIKNGFSSHNGIHYIKLHGSYGWKSSNEANQLVIGTNKESLIETEPLLKGYLDLLKNVIKEGDKKVMIIGYGFGDTHINKILLEGVMEHGLKIYILSTQSPENLKYKIEHGHYYAKDIFTGLSGYFQVSLKEIFPSNQEETVYFNQIIKSLCS